MLLLLCQQLSFLLHCTNVPPKQVPSRDYLAEPPSLRPEISASQDHCDWFNPPVVLGSNLTQFQKVSMLEICFFQPDCNVDGSMQRS